MSLEPHVLVPGGDPHLPGARLRQTNRVFGVVTFVVFSTTSLFHSPVNAEVKQLTTNNYEDDYPQINNDGYVVWMGK